MTAAGGHRLRAKVAVVTGAGQGIGRAIAERLAAEGASVILAELNPETAAAAAAAIGPAAQAIPTDVTDRSSVGGLVEAVLDAHGRIDIAVNNAGWDRVGPFIDSEPADWERIVQVNLYGVLNVSRAVLPVMAEQGSGAVVNIASDAGRVGSSGEAVYSAAKGGVIAFTKAVARELARRGVRVNCVCPGPTDTPLFAAVGGDDPKLREALIRAIPLRRLAQPAELAGAVAFLASEEAAYITGQTLSVSGGLTMV